MLIAELDHRVENLLARVAGISTYTRQGSNSMDQFVEVLDRRIQSMANAHHFSAKAAGTASTSPILFTINLRLMRRSQTQ